ncbi:hypothetical protein [Gluconobacter potus]|uniref:hypothetical protein n=1 Tax=Gluconobacter potus TaxID=2724927 RepID=UPI0039E75818
MSDATNTIAQNSADRKAAPKASPASVRRFNEARERTKAISLPTCSALPRTTTRLPQSFSISAMTLATMTTCWGPVSA